MSHSLGNLYFFSLSLVILYFKIVLIDILKTVIFLGFVIGIYIIKLILHCARDFQRDETVKQLGDEGVGCAFRHLSQGLVLG